MMLLIVTALEHYTYTITNTNLSFMNFAHLTVLSVVLFFFSGRVEKKERARLKTVKFNSKTRGEKGVSL